MSFVLCSLILDKYDLIIQIATIKVKPYYYKYDKRLQRSDNRMLSICDNKITLTRGDSCNFEVTIIDSVSGVPYEIKSQDSLVFSAKKNLRSTDFAINKTYTGTNTIKLLPTDTKSLSFGLYKYDVQLTLSTGEVYTIIPSSDLVIAPEVS